MMYLSGRGKHRKYPQICAYPHQHQKSYFHTSPITFGVRLFKRKIERATRSYRVAPAMRAKEPCTPSWALVVKVAVQGLARRRRSLELEGRKPASAMLL
jgi:hypothetical protein